MKFLGMSWRASARHFWLPGLCSLDRSLGAWPWGHGGTLACAGMTARTGIRYRFCCGWDLGRMADRRTGTMGAKYR